MATITIFEADDLPGHLAWQIRGFARSIWPHPYHEDLAQPVLPEEWHPTFVILHQDELLLSHACVVWQHIEHEGQRYKLFGLSCVFTYPAQRGKTFGDQVVAAATEYIDACDGDIAMLFTGLVGFYERHGWQRMNKMTVLFGDPDEPAVTPDGAMMRFFSVDRAKFDNAQLYFGRDWW